VYQHAGGGPESGDDPGGSAVAEALRDGVDRVRPGRGDDRQDGGDERQEDRDVDHDRTWLLGYLTESVEESVPRGDRAATPAALRTGPDDGDDV